MPDRSASIPPNLVNDLLTFFKGESGETPAFGALTAGMDVRFTAHITGLPSVKVMRVKIVPAPATGPTAGDTDAAKSMYQNLIKEVIDSVPESPVAAVIAIKECWYKYFYKAETPETIQERAYFILKPDTLDAVWSFEPVKLDGVNTFQQLLQNFKPILTTNGTRAITLQHLIVFEEMCITLFSAERQDEVDIDDFMRLVVMLLQSTNTLRWVRRNNVAKYPYPTHGSATSIWLSVKPGDSLSKDQFKNRKMLKFLTKHVTYNRKPLQLENFETQPVSFTGVVQKLDQLGAASSFHCPWCNSIFETKKLAGVSKEGALYALSVKPGDSLSKDQFKNRKMLKFLTKHVTYNRKPLQLENFETQPVSFTGVVQKLDQLGAASSFHCPWCSSIFESRTNRRVHFTHCIARLKLGVMKAAADTTSDLVAVGHVVIGSSLLNAFVTFAAKKLAGVSKEGALYALVPLLEILRCLVVDKDIMTPTGYLLKEMGITGTTMDFTQVTTLRGMSRDQLSPYTSSDEEESAAEEADLRRFGPRPKRARKETAARNPPPGPSFKSGDKSKSRKNTSESDVVSSSDSESDD
ncbi:hypothetical protein ONE63_003454 [Megalurothrips usitatus]|uniref:Uncharacterized protein n=1 Tax=Megalurothrips usitatus TaxID=439358 RepID=A0AAV7XDD2_9NEOP|nr:hypothetical protein ONE63_003454 [Megalurothrips usitatus]